MLGRLINDVMHLGRVHAPREAAGQATLGQTNLGQTAEGVEAPELFEKLEFVAFCVVLAAGLISIAGALVIVMRLFIFFLLC